MNRDARWRGLYGGCDGRKGEEMGGDESHGITSPLYLQRSPPRLRAVRFSQTTIVFLSQHERQEGARSMENESIESKKKRYKECGQGI